MAPVAQPSPEPSGHTPSPRRGSTVADVGEFGLIDLLVRRLPVRPGVLLGPGDDAAVIEAADGRVVATTDLLVEGRHFRRDWATARQVGVRAAAANLADVAAMGAVPTALLVGLALPADTPVDWVVELTDGLAAEAGVVGAGVVGGDVVRAPLVVVSVAALGDLQGRPPVTRAGARPGDTVALAGRVGWAAAGLDLRRAGVGSGERVTGEHGAGEDVTGQDWLRALLDAYARPVVWYDEGPRAAAAGVHALCDVSDGLLADLGHIAAASGVQVELDLPAVRGLVASELVQAGRVLGVDPLDWVLTGGDDHAFVGCFPPQARLTSRWTPIGRVHAGTDNEGTVQTVGTAGKVDVPGWAGSSVGWDHFAGEPPSRRAESNG